MRSHEGVISKRKKRKLSFALKKKKRNGPPLEGSEGKAGKKGGGWTGEGGKGGKYHLGTPLSKLKKKNDSAVLVKDSKYPAIGL